MSKEEDSTLLSKLLNFNPFKSKNDSHNSHQYEKQQPSNTINELQILIAHTDIVRLVQKIDETRIASASDDATINIWNYVTGEKLLTLVGHKMPITCLLLLDRNVLVSGSSDRTMRMWDLAKGHCTRIMTAHQGSIKAFCMLPRGMFCSGANDRQLCIWSLDGELISTIERQEEETNEWVVTASNSQFLLAYHIDGQQPFKLLAYHRESVQCLVRISDKFFASASLDGCLVVWNTDSLSPGRVLAYPENYKSSEKIFIYSVHYLLPLGEGYLVVAIGKKVELYDVVTGECILECENTHESNITCMISLYGGTRLLTSSADSSIKIWELPNLGQLNSNSSNVVMSPKRQRKKKTNHPIKAVCAGDMWGHSDGVYCMTPLTDNSLASCGGDGCVVLWKDGQVQSDMRNGFAAVSLLHHAVDDCEEYEHEFFPFTEFSDGSYDGSMDPNRLDPLGQVFYEDCEIDTQSPPSLYPPISSTSSHLYPMLTTPAAGQPTTATGSTPTNTSSLLMTSSTSPATRSSPLSGSPSSSFGNKRSGSITVPEYIFSYSQGLRKEKKLSLDEIAGHLRDQGHSENLISIVTQRLLETS